MINTTIKYIVYNHSGTGVRHHHFSTQNNIIDQANGTASTGDSINALGIASLPFNGNNLPFAFMSVHGAADGNHLYTSPGNQTIPVGSSNIDILVVYAPPGGIGGPNGGPGVWVDAFNVDTGNFSDSNFIEILNPPTPPENLNDSKTNFANAEGVVGSDMAENMRAFLSVDSAPFLEWKKIYPSETIVNTATLPLAVNETSEIWFAFYQTIPSDVSIGKIRDRFEATIGKWVIDDYCGTPPPHHIGPVGPLFQISLPEKVMRSLSPASREKLAGISKEYPIAAQNVFNAMTKMSGLLKSVQDIAASVKGK